MTDKKELQHRQWEHRAEDAISALEHYINHSELIVTEGRKRYSVLSDSDRSPNMTHHERGFLLLMIALLYSTLSIDRPVHRKDEDELNDYGMTANRKREREQRTLIEPQQTTVINSSRTFFYDNPISRI